MTPGCSRIFAVPASECRQCQLEDRNSPPCVRGGAQQEKTWAAENEQWWNRHRQGQMLEHPDTEEFVPVALDGEPRDQDQQYTAEEEAGRPRPRATPDRKTSPGRHPSHTTLPVGLRSVVGPGAAAAPTPPLLRTKARPRVKRIQSITYVVPPRSYCVVTSQRFERLSPRRTMTIPITNRIATAPPRIGNNSGDPSSESASAVAADGANSCRRCCTSGKRRRIVLRRVQGEGVRPRDRVSVLRDHPVTNGVSARRHLTGRHERNALSLHRRLPGSDLRPVGRTDGHVRETRLNLLIENQFHRTRRSVENCVGGWSRSDPVHCVLARCLRL